VCQLRRRVDSQVGEHSPAVATSARMTFARKRMGPGGFRGLQIRWAGLSRVGRRVRFPCASATSTEVGGGHFRGHCRV